MSHAFQIAIRAKNDSTIFLTSRMKRNRTAWFRARSVKIHKQKVTASTQENERCNVLEFSCPCFECLPGNA